MKQNILIVKESGPRLDKYLADQLEDISRSQIQKYIKNECVLVNGSVQNARYRLSENDEIEMRFDQDETYESHIIPQDIPLEIVYEDSDVILINKPPGLTVHPGVGNRDGTLANALAYHFKDLSNVNGPLRPGIVHRLDQDTSGIILIAKSNAVHMKLAEQFSKRGIKKEYFGITWGKWNDPEGIIDEPIARKRQDPTSFLINAKGKDSLTAYKIAKETTYFSFVDYFPKTGRTHQIRVHSAFNGHPILGDQKYGGGKARIKGYIPEITFRLEEIFKLINRHMLHAKSISFIHPSNGKEVSFNADFHDDVKKVISKIGELDV